MGTELDQLDESGRRLGEEAMQRLRLRSVCAIDPGLTDAELDRVEHEFGFQFADDHRAFLAAGLPVNSRSQAREPGVIYTHPEPWPDWRRGDRRKLRDLVNWPIEGVLFDVENNSFWFDSWDPRRRPVDRSAATTTGGSCGWTPIESLLC